MHFDEFQTKLYSRYTSIKIEALELTSFEHKKVSRLGI